MSPNCLPCFACGVDLQNACGSVTVNQPSRGTAFMTHGHYGSGFFDSIDGSEYLEIAICDNCLHRNMERTRTGKTDMADPPPAVGPQEEE